MNAQFKGRHEAEHAWFAISAALPGASTSAGRAADQIISACAHGDPALTITLPAGAAAALNGLAPSAVARIMAIAARLLPGPAGPGGNLMRLGRESESRWAPSLVTTLNDRAAVLNNEV